MRKKIVILGSTGSIGENAVKVAKALPEQFEVVGLAAGSQVEKILQQARELNCSRVVLGNEAHYEALRKAAPAGVTVGAGIAAMEELAALPEVDTVLCAIVGNVGIRPVLAALRAGKRVALASKEVMVAAGTLVHRELDAGHGEICPVDSEHSAIWQCLAGKAPSEVRKLLLTGSGGPFLRVAPEVLAQAGPEAALRHPTWRMGRRITIDSATLMNKALEVIEAAALFRVPGEKITVVIHPQSVVHSMVELIDGSVIAQLAPPDMRLAIQYAMSYPERFSGGLERLDWTQMRSLEFLAPDRKRFPSLDFADAALRAGGTMPAVVNAADEIAVARFLQGEFPLPGIWKIIEATMNAHTAIPVDRVETVFEADAEARRFAAAFRVNGTATGV